MKKTIFIVLAGIIATAVIAFHSPGNEPSAETADKIFINGKILTVDARNSVAHAVAIKNGRIIEVGNVQDILKLGSKETIVVDLQGKVLIPGFIDGHSHFMGWGRSKSANVAAPPVGKVHNIPELVREIQQFKTEKPRVGDLIPLLTSLFSINQAYFTVALFMSGAAYEPVK